MKPRRVFLSHTSDLATSAEAAGRAVTRAGHIPVDMRYFPAEDRPPSEVCVAAVQSAGVYVLIAGARYGSPVRDRPDLSYTELEFLTAGQAGIPRLAFLLDSPAEPRQQSFRDRVTDSGLTAAVFTDASGLETQVYQALIELDRREVPPVWSVPPLRGTEVARPSLTEALVEAVLAPDAGSVGVTTGLVGAGGFGKTTLARMVAHRVRESFPAGVAWVTVGEDTAGPELAAAITSVARLFDPLVPEVTDALAAGSVLGRALADRPVLLVVDDVWTPEQVEPFLVGGDRTVRLFTTRQHDVLPAGTARVPVDQMTSEEARRMLGDGPPAGLLNRALKATGRWPVLLALVNGAMRDGLEAGGDPARELRTILAALRADGITVLDVGNEGARSQAVERTMKASMQRLTEDEQSRYLELAVFAEDVPIPGDVVNRLWAYTGGWSPFKSRRFLNRLYRLSLLASYRRDPDEAQLHDVVRAYLRHRTDEVRAGLDQAVVEAHRPLSPAGWADLPAEERYLWTWLPAHLWGARLYDELNDLHEDPGWLLGKLQNVGSAALESDLTLASRHELASVVRQNAHVLSAMDSRRWLAATLASRLPPGEGFQELRRRLREVCGEPLLLPLEPLPDRPHPALVRVFPGLGELAVLKASKADGWIAYLADDNTIKLRDPVDGELIATLKGIHGDVRALEVAPDGEWLAASCDNGIVLIWDTPSGAVRHRLKTDLGEVRTLAAGPDGSWLAGYGLRARQVELWNTRTGIAEIRLDRRALPEDSAPFAVTHRSGVKGGLVRAKFGGSLVADPRGRWIAVVACSDNVGPRQVFHVWDLATGRERELQSWGKVTAVALAVEPRGAWLATADDDGTLRIWDTETWTARSFPAHRIPRCEHIALAAAANGRWLAAARDGYVATVIDVEEGRIVAEVPCRGRSAAFAVSPDGTWLAASAGDTVTVWNTTDWTERTELTGHGGTVAGLVSIGEGVYLASAASGRAVRVWDATTAGVGNQADSHSDVVTAVAVSPDMSSIASQSDDGTVRLWDVGNGKCARTWDISRSGEPVDLSRGWSAVFDEAGEVAVNRDSVVDDLLRVAEPWGSDYLRLSGFSRWHAFPAILGLSMVLGSLDMTSTETHPSTGGLRRESSNRYQRMGDNWTNLIALSPPSSGRSWLLTLSRDQRIRLWKPRTGNHFATLEGQVQAFPKVPDRAIAADVNGAWLAVADARSMLHIWNPATGARRHILTGHVGGITDLTATPDGLLCSVGEDCTVRVWDAIAGELVSAIRVEHPLSHVAATRDRIIATGSRFLYFFDLVGG